MQALLFDCDGVLAETERDGHRVAYNEAMRELKVNAQWSPKYYAELVRISGGKERLRYYFSRNPGCCPADADVENLIAVIYQRKTELFQEMASDGRLLGRSGIKRMIREAKAQHILLFVCSTSHRDSVRALIRSNFGQECLESFTDFFCGDIVKAKKPAPDVYNLAAEQYHLSSERCLVIEDSRNGLLAAKAAGFHCLVTPSFYTKEEMFGEADAVVSALGDPDGEVTTNIRVPKDFPEEKWLSIEALSRFTE